MQSTSQAAITFGDAVDIDLTTVGGPSVLDNVTALDFGTSTAPSSLARFALNTTDNGDGVLSPGDTTRLVGHVLVSSYEVASAPGTFTPIPAGIQLTAIVQLDGMLVASGAGLANSFSGGFIEIFGDTSADFMVTDVKTSVDGTSAATFNLTSGTATLDPIPGSGLASATSLTAILDQSLPTTDFFLLPSGDSLSTFGLDMYIQTSSLEGFVPPGVDPNPYPLLGIGEAAGDPVDVDYATFTPRPPNSFDVFLASDGSVEFAIVPEATSLLVWSGFAGLLGLARGRRRSA